jgi:hypothetical protein
MVNAVKGFWTLCILSIRWSVGDHLTVRDFGPYAIIFTNVCHNRYQCNAVKLFWALWDNIYDCLYYFNFSHHS